ncbi:MULTISPECIES: alpha/beta hydrolase [unclassified Caballeronia]|uniref:alpha/beta hydrolase n=2 Tax=Caballeronia TaxID=1827195 RepID=UPI0020286D86|nr:MULTISPECIES: alpha/beta fold hydrolase [unclassified Caballeronia]MDR5774518.1 alpha/beta fold hydrolase [Caballeronia sp. LZ002]MDR5849954.1 alpha/beta fold hydrolase [Caballeronia sp. LZ003]
MPLLSHGLRFAIAAYLLAALTLFMVQDRMLLPSTPSAPDLRTVPHAGASIDLLQVRDQFAGYVVTPAGREPRGTFMVYHGNEESADTKLPLADVFVRDGYRVVIVEYPGHGRRPGERTMKAALAASREALAATIAQWRGPLYLVGESLGAGMAAQVVKGNEAALAGVVLITPWDSLADVAAEKYPIFPIRWMLHDGFDSVAAVSHYDGPLVIVGAQLDTLIPVMHARRFANEHERARFMLLPTADHDHWFGVMTQADWRQVLQWMHAG